MMGNFFGSGLCLGIDRFKQLGSTRATTAPTSSTAERLLARGALQLAFAEQDQSDFDEMPRTFDLDA